MSEISGTAIILADDFVNGDNCKTTHGLIRKSLRFDILGVVDEKNSGNDAGQLLDGHDKRIPVSASVEDLLAQLDEKPMYCIVGMATVGGVITPFIVKHGVEALKSGISLISGLHHFVGEHKLLIGAAKAGDADLIDIRRSKPRSELNFWTGNILNVKAPRIALLGSDCNIGKRTSAQFLVDKCQEMGVKAEMIFTGQSGWLQGGKYGFILDTTVNDFVSGELENAIIQCDLEALPDILFLEGQSSLRNPSGPCGSELIVSGKAEAVILQYGPGYKYFQDLEGIRWKLGAIQDEIELVRLYGSRVIAVTLNMNEVPSDKEKELEHRLRKQLNIPVINVLKDGVDELMPLVKDFIEKYKKV
ncbi:MAG: Uncharacterised protein [Owenweeksia sp. TMED14]|nr:MAG: Uncharacterised protein [Owenweeksia sp. TMED14]|tara:strand:+ start:473 stop:1552 length:1080 start_codon:yes stop_codon:yes gene_type:complete